MPTPGQLVRGSGSHLQAANFALVASRAAAVVAGHQRSGRHAGIVLVVQQEGGHLPDGALAWADAFAQPMLQAPEAALRANADCQVDADRSLLLLTLSSPVRRMTCTDSSSPRKS